MVGSLDVVMMVVMMVVWWGNVERSQSQDKERTLTHLSTLNEQRLDLEQICTVHVNGDVLAIDTFILQFWICDRKRAKKKETNKKKHPSAYGGDWSSVTIIESFSPA